MIAMNDDAMHSSTSDALVFAFNFSEQQFARSALARKMGGFEQKPGHESRGLVGEIGAGDAAYIWNVLYAMAEINPLYLAVLYAKYAPRDYPCNCQRDCCCGIRKNKIWQGVINYLTQESARHINASISHHRLRQAIVLNIFARDKSEKLFLGEVAKKCGVHADTVGKYNSLIRHWISGKTAMVGGKAQRVPGLINLAYDNIDERLRFMGEVAA